MAAFTRHIMLSHRQSFNMYLHHIGWIVLALAHILNAVRIVEIALSMLPLR